MHELSIAESILDTVKRELALYPGAVPQRVGIRVGAMTAIDPDSLSFCFECVVRGTDWEMLRLEIRTTPTMRICRNCGYTFEVKDYNSDCTACKSHDTEPDGGDELEFEFLEVETDGTLAAQAKSIE